MRRVEIKGGGGIRWSIREWQSIGCVWGESIGRGGKRVVERVGRGWNVGEG